MVLARNLPEDSVFGETESQNNESVEALHSTLTALDLSEIERQLFL